MRNQDGIEVMAKGYVYGACCEKDHSGSVDLYRDVKDTYQCEGCRNVYSVDEVRTMIEANKKR